MSVGLATAYPQAATGRLRVTQTIGWDAFGSSRRSALLSRPVCEQFKCPSHLLDFALSADLPSEPGYFEFGSDVVCYGRSRSQISRTNLESPLEDLLPQCKVKGTTVQLPFDPAEAVDNLRFERYPQESRTAYERFLKKIYYRLRPLTNQGLRKRVQKFYAGDWQQVRFPQWPVDTTVEAICEQLLLQGLQVPGVEKIPFIWFWPRGAQGCVVMTHDVETEAGRDFCLDLAKIDEEFDIRASFQIIPEDRYAISQSLLASLRTQGCEIGVHDLNHDGKLFDDREDFLRRVKRVNEYGRQYQARGFRSAVLYRNLDWYESLDFSFDMSAPNVAHLDPQRGGCCTVMPYFVGNVLEIPLTTTQDYTLFHLLEERSIELWKTQVERVLQKNGLISFIVHPDYLLNRDTRSVYQDLLRHLSELREKTPLWFAIPSEVDTWWRQRSRMSVVKDGCSWRIEGEGSDRAMLVYAKDVNGKLAYEFPPPEGRVSAVPTKPA